MSGIIERIKEKFFGKEDLTQRKANNIDEILDELPPPYLAYLREEAYYRRICGLVILLLVFGVGGPLWWHTTRTYRAPMELLANNFTIPLSITVAIGSTEDSLRAQLEDVCAEVEDRLQIADVSSPLLIKWSVVVARDDDDSLESSSTALLRVNLLSPTQWPHYSATLVHFGAKGVAEVQYTDREKAVNRIYDAVWDVLVDVPHLNSIIDRDTRGRLEPWQVAALPLSQQKRLVWDSAPIAVNYVVQVVVVHDEATTITPKGSYDSILHAINVFAKKLEPYTSFKVTLEHVWQLDMPKYIEKDVQNRWVMSQQNLENLIAETDSHLHTVESEHSVQRIIVLESEHRIILKGLMDDDSTAAAVASWGVVVSRSRKLSDDLSRILGGLRVLLGLDSELPSGWTRSATPLADWEVERLRLRATVDNIMRAAASLKALREMTNKITNIAISDEVAARANEAVSIIRAMPTQREMFLSVVRARRLSDEALSHPSLLAMLYFPQDQRVAVYLPIMLPILLPVVQSLYALVKWIAFPGKYF